MTPLTAQSWNYDEFFDPLPPRYLSPEIHPTILLGRKILEESKIADHPFFNITRSSKKTLSVWAKQECVITNHFSQTLFSLMALIRNVHVRSLLTPVVMGEHSPLKDGMAVGSHPHLLSKLIHDMDISPNSILPLPPTVKFAKFLSASVENKFFGLGALGIGNESMLVPEYTAIESCFSQHYSRATYRPFLRANIEEDKMHSNLMEMAAVSLFKTTHDEDDYRTGALEGVSARIDYYDELMDFI